MGLPKRLAAETTEQLRVRIPSWGADSERSLRPPVPRELFDLVNGAHWDFPERQPKTTSRERSIDRTRNSAARVQHHDAA